MGNSTTYYPSDLCTSPANDTGYIFPGFFNAVLVSGLTPNTKYYYVVGDPVNYLTYKPTGGGLNTKTVILLQ